MNPPRATYRLQLRGGMTFDRAAALAEYWRRLGVSHLYLSPVFAAVAGSTHGYDVTDAAALDPTLGGERGFRRLASALRAQGLGLIVDFVPNHMAASPQNPWWADVLRHGADSRYARHFDIDFRAGPLTLPFLAKPFEAVARGEEFSIETDGGTGHVLRYFDTAYPLSPDSGALIEAAGEDLTALSRDGDFLERLHAAQAWRLDDWRTGRHRLSYRRFFEITGLVGVRVEDEQVFDDLHRTLFSLVDEGLVDGIRIDHVDGLTDPAAYLQRLRERVGERVYTVVEKILGRAEKLPPAWPVAGTTGYERIEELAGLLTQEDEAGGLDLAYTKFVGRTEGYEEEERAAKREIFGHNLEAELLRLLALASAALDAGEPGAGREVAADSLRRALVALAVELPVYRTYVDRSGASEADLAVIDAAAERARRAEPSDADAIARLAALWRLEVPGAARDAALAFVGRFQQTTAALMAKAVEDTVFYRYGRLIALNEVGGHPLRTGTGVTAWHDAMRACREEATHALVATATHDTKRGADARARLYAISEAPELWRAAVERWSAMVVGAPPVDLETQWMLYQSLLGAWPMDVESRRDFEPALASRLAEFAEKAVREAKRHTSWTHPDADYEGRVRAYVAALFSADNAPFRADFAGTVRPFLRAGAVNGLVQLLLNLVAPGVPDIYQGTELWDLSLVDPDNRRPPDFERLGAAARRIADGSGGDHAADDWIEGDPKLRLLMAGLEARAASPELFAFGSYEPVDVSGPASGHVVAFARVHEGRAVVAVAPRHVLGHVAGDTRLALEASWLRGTTLDLAPHVAGDLRDACTGAVVAAGRVDCGRLLGRMPVALLVV